MTDSVAVATAIAVAVVVRQFDGPRESVFVGAP
ncbi:uncharacterized protein Nmag_1240 [Natrialba magadii ATCC 43099]|uniref:Uncharacterized protein n=1 Tax=Natrialba magadii (strain ATCC 43099 / DSM 3394 / CCM 3739 / CIP 104546 / IAM 13178 / JCM 8861 / NBRC 102185 / NCIMB 2190 / MS3) TaxID=547559 RepID=D3SS96_NATMM|nr:uncharacterized protein Nmag_1240 [Natrialba magadii ATCC 43099]